MVVNGFRLDHPIIGSTIYERWIRNPLFIPTAVINNSQYFTVTQLVRVVYADKKNELSLNLSVLYPLGADRQMSVVLHQRSSLYYV